MAPKFYYHPISAYSRKVLIALYEKEIPFEANVVNLFDPAVREAYTRDINPMGKIPYLIRDDGWRIPESSIIMEYLDTHYTTGPQLLSNDKDLARQARFCDRMGDLYLIDPMGFLFFEARKPAAQQNKDRMTAETKTLHTTLGLINKYLEGKTYMINNQFGYGDIGPAAGVYYLQMMGYNLADWPHVQRWFNVQMQRPSWQRVIKETEPYMAEFNKL